MKKCFLSMIFIGAISFAHAQVSKGDILLGGNLGFNKQTPSANYTTTNFSIDPSIGKAIKDNLVVGANLSFAHYTSKADVGHDKDDSYGLQGFIRKYKYLGSGFAVFAEGSLSLSYSTGSGAYGGSYPYTTSSKDYGIAAGFAPGVTYAISRHVQLETGLSRFLSLGYFYSRWDQTPDPSTGDGKTGMASHSVSFSSSLNQAFNNLTVGVRFII